MPDDLLSPPLIGIAHCRGRCAIMLSAGLDHAGMPVGLEPTAADRHGQRLRATAFAADRVLGVAADRVGTLPLLGA